MQDDTISYSMGIWLKSDKKHGPWNAISNVGLSQLDIPSRMEQKQKQADILSTQPKVEVLEDSRKGKGS
jgi:hypothetical protein